MTKDKKQEMYKVLKSLRMSEEEIWARINETSDLEDYTPITYRELVNMSEEELSNLYSYCWHDGAPRCDCTGITDVLLEEASYSGKKYYILSYSDGCGDPHFTFDNYDDFIDNVGDGEWNYGLYKKK